MLIDPTTSYDQSKIAYLLELREKIILHLAASFPPEKILILVRPMILCLLRPKSFSIRH